MNMQSLRATLALLAALSHPVAADAEAPQAGLDVEFGAGFRHDSNVGIADIDDNSGTADTARRLEAGIAARLPVSESLTLRLGYDYSDTAYSELSEYDLRLHSAVAELGVEAAGYVAALTFDHYLAWLDGDEYLRVTQLTPSVSKLFGSSLYLRGAFTAASREYEVLTNRDADSAAVRLDAYWLMDGMHRYIAIGLQSGEENAADDELDYDSVVSMLTLGQTVSTLPLPIELKVQVRREDRDYRHVSTSAPELRRDQRLRAALTATIPLSEHLELEAIIERSSNESNLESADLGKMAYGLSVSATF